MLKSKVVRLYRYYSKFILTLVVCSLCFITILLSILGSYSDRSLNLCNVPSEDELLNYEYKPEANYSFHETLRRNANIKNGGHWEPTLCTARYHTIIIIPFRDRAEQLPIILAHLHSFLQLQLLDYKIVVVEQTDSDVPFNKAMLMNIAFKVINQKYPQYDCFIFHDVDMIPEDARNLYRCGRFPRHLSPAVDEFNYTMPYPTIVGGVFAINQKQFRLVNGFSNMYWGWGAEDDDMYYRVKFSNLFLSRPLEDIGRYTMLKHPKRKRWGPRINLLIRAATRFKSEGLAQLDTMIFNVISYSELPLYTHILVDVHLPVTTATVS